MGGGKFSSWDPRGVVEPACYIPIRKSSTNVGGVTLSGGEWAICTACFRLMLSWCIEWGHFAQFDKYFLCQTFS